MQGRSRLKAVALPALGIFIRFDARTDLSPSSHFDAQTPFPHLCVSFIPALVTSELIIMSLTAIVTQDDCAQVQELIALSDADLMTWQTEYVFNNTLVLQVLNADNKVLGEARIAITDAVRSYCGANRIPTHTLDDAFDGKEQFVHSADYPEVYNADGFTVGQVIDSEMAKRKRAD